MQRKRKSSRKSWDKYRQSVRRLVDMGVLLAEDEYALEVRFSYDEELANIMHRVKVMIERVRWDGKNKRWLVPLSFKGENLNSFVEFLKKLMEHSTCTVYVSGRVVKKLERARAKKEEEKRQLQLLTDIFGDISRGWVPNVFLLSKEEIERFTTMGVFTDQEKTFLLRLSAWENNFLNRPREEILLAKAMPRSLLSESMWETIHKIQQKFEEFLEGNPEERRSVLKATIERIKQLCARLLSEPRELAHKIAARMLPIGLVFVTRSPLGEVIREMKRGIEAIELAETFRALRYGRRLHKREEREQTEATASWETPLEKIYTLADILKMLGVSQEELDEINEKRTQRGLKPIEIQINTHEER